MSCLRLIEKSCYLWVLTREDLAYYEIQQILSNNSDIKVIHDKEAAVKYFTWDTNQWISYDDEDTFKQKIDWANSIGFSGSLIWASDLGIQTSDKKGHFSEQCTNIY